MAMPTSLHKFGQELRRFLNRKEVYELLPEGTWQAGGCWILARALTEFLGPPAELWAVASALNPVEHVVVRYVDLYIDADGIHTKDELLRTMRVDEGIPKARLVKFTPGLQEAAVGTGVVCPIGPVRDLVKMLQRKFG